jgi:hypothetical protein
MLDGSIIYHAYQWMFWFGQAPQLMELTNCFYSIGFGVGHAAKIIYG